MVDTLRGHLRSTFEVAISFLPWLISLYLLYWFDYGEIWSSVTPHRGKITVTILIVGMVLSFLIQSYFIKQRQK